MIGPAAKTLPGTDFFRLAACFLQVSRKQKDNQERANHLKSAFHEILIVADDLTGACDAAVAFASASQTIVCIRLPCSAGLSLCSVLSVSTESRDVESPEMCRRMNAVAEQTGAAKLIFKKIDSTLRGNVPAEIEAARQAFACTTAIVTPAFPDMGRTVVDRHLHIDGVLIKHAGEHTLDALTNGDLDRIVEDGLKLPGRVLWAGSAGLAKALARKLYGGSTSKPAPSIHGPIVFCIGSDHPATQAQQAELYRHRPDAKIVLISRTQTIPDDIREGLREAGALFVTGGDTASVVFQAIGAEAIAIQSEVVTGVPWGRLTGGLMDGCPVVTKSGGFGQSDTLIRVADFFPAI